MLETSQTVAEGWYPDPHGRLLLRRWTGTEWTTETMGNDAWAFEEPDFNSPRAALSKPETGWAGIAFALRSAMVKREPVKVTVNFPAMNSTLVVNTFDHQYVWTNEPPTLPATPTAVQVTFAPGDVTGGMHGQSLDGLLWKISRIAFPGRLAPWLQPDDLYRMQRWPNLTTINPELDDMRQAAMLANGMFTVEELAGFSDRSLASTRTLINALSMMNTLKVATPRDSAAMPLQAASAAPAQAQPSSAAPLAAAPKQGLFQRLRAKLGM